MVNTLTLQLEELKNVDLQKKTISPQINLPSSTLNVDINTIKQPIQDKDQKKFKL